jgi:hypothetical protein
MKTQFAVVSSALLVTLGVVSGCGEAAINKANHMKDEANAAAAAADQIIDDTKPKFDTLFSSANIAGFPANRGEFETTARETAELHAKSAEQYRLAASKFDEAAKQGIDKVVAEYFGLWNQVMAKSAEQRDIRREHSLLWLDKEIDTQEKFEARRSEIQKRFDAHAAAVAELVAKAKKLEADNAGKFD